MAEGCCVGLDVVGETEGVDEDGSSVGFADGEIVGNRDGAAVGDDGAADGMKVGIEGSIEGNRVGDILGCIQEGYTKGFETGDT